MVICSVIACEELTRRAILPWLDARRLMSLRLELQAQCLRHTDPPDQIIFASSKNQRDKMHLDWAMQRFTGGDSEARGVVPLAWDQEINLRTGIWAEGAMGTALVHELHCRNGISRLVGVDIADGQNNVLFLCSVIAPGRTQLSNRVGIRMPMLRRFIETAEDFRVFAAQLDPSDPAAFAIPCAVTGTIHGKTLDIQEIVDGRLNPDGTVSLTPRVGFDPHSLWELVDSTGQPLTPWNSPLRKQYGGGPRFPIVPPN
jgi:hypothetical protein